MPTLDLRTRPMGPDDFRTLLALDLLAFPSATQVDELAAYPFPGEWDRVYGLFDGQRLVAMHMSLPFTGFPVPGGSISASGLSWVGVDPQYRRQGLLRRMIAHHFAASLRRGEPISVLNASEPPIYGRFGYGSACQELTLTVPRGARLREVPGSEDLSVQIDRLRPEHVAELAAAHARVNRPGWAKRTTPRLRAHMAEDPPFNRDGAEPALVAIVRRGGECVGWAQFARRLSWPGGNPEGQVIVKEVVAQTGPIAHALWSRLLDLDLMSTIKVTRIAPDDPLVNLLVNLRVCAPRLIDNVWLRILDLPAALTARGYLSDLDVVLDIDDALLASNTGRWHLVAAHGRASVQRTDAPPDLTMSIDTLARAYLGGTSLRALASAGQVSAADEAMLGAASVAFAADAAPACSWMF